MDFCWSLLLSTGNGGDLMLPAVFVVLRTAVVVVACVATVDNVGVDG